MAEDTPTIAPEIEETTATIEEEAVTESIPTEEVVENPPESESLPEPKKKPGRPAGSRNKAPTKPRAKRVVVSEAVEYAPPPRVEYAPPPSPKRSQWDAQHQPIPTEAKTEMAELMLRLLSGQSAERQRRKDALRRSWFA